eukprot:TRINITY_DN1718_c0_g1_i1.p1 TRINITY_DN1718_c0_g1~~TRINITY_DN1718_c0_g1_i1.p1  ORF type:complete len:495 (+),score=98.66 TRINITY_DN1718_c0_g1_i1:156-1640(+)
MEDQAYAPLLEERGRQPVRLVKAPPPADDEGCCDMKLASFVIIGGITLVYCIGELGVAIWLNSLTLLSDGFHNLSDVISLYIAFWAVRASKRDVTDAMSYGWARAEILGGLTNGCFLLSLCLYVVLESIPRFIKVEELDGGYPFIAVAAAGLLVNTIGTLAFAATGLSHGHSHGGGGGHGHSHGGGHSHAGKAKKKEKHGHSHGGEKKEKKHGHSHSHSHGGDEEEGFALDTHATEEGHGHAHSHGKKEKHKEKHGHSHGGGDDHGHAHGDKKKKKHGHSHDSHEKKVSWSLDLNMWGVFIHYAGDMLSSAIVLVSGLLLKFVGGKWTLYIDPVASLIIVVLILWTTFPLMKECFSILLQSTPSTVELGLIRQEIMEMQGVESVHELHVWQLAEGKVVGSVHISVEEGMDFKSFIKSVKEIFHEHGIHSTTIQPEFVPKNYPSAPFCAENCVKDCEEDWCCKKTADRHRKMSQAMPAFGELDSERVIHHGGSFH